MFEMKNFEREKSNSDTETIDIEEFYNESLKEGRETALMLHKLMTRKFGDILNREDNFLAMATKGDKDSAFISYTSLSWIELNVTFASNCPLFCDSDKSLPPPVSPISGSYDLVRRLAFDLMTGGTATEYMGAFNVGTYQDWIHDDKDEKWYPQKTKKDSADKSLRAMDPSVNITPMGESRQSVCHLDGNNTRFYMMGDQRALAAVMGLRDLVRNRVLQELNGEGKPITGRRILLDRIVDQAQRATGESKEDLIRNLEVAMKRENVVIKFVPVVCKGESRAEAEARILNLFLSLNPEAKTRKNASVDEEKEPAGGFVSTL